MFLCYCTHKHFPSPTDFSPHTPTLWYHTSCYSRTHLQKTALLLPRGCCRATETCVPRTWRRSPVAGPCVQVARSGGAVRWTPSILHHCYRSHWYSLCALCHQFIAMRPAQLRVLARVQTSTTNYPPLLPVHCYYLHCDSTRVAPNVPSHNTPPIHQYPFICFCNQVSNFSQA